MEPDQGFQEIVGEGKGSWEMRRVLIYAGIILSVLVGLLSLAIVVVNLIPGNYYKSFIISKVGSKTGRELTIVGDLDIKLFTTFAFKMSGIKVSNAEWGSRSHMISVDNIEGELALFPLLRGILDLTLVVDKSDLLLETHSSGQGNWQFGELIKEATEVKKAAEEVAGAAQETESGGWLPLRPFIRKLHLNETHITFLDGKSGDRIIIQNEKLHVGSTEDELPIELRGKFNDIPLAFSGGFDSADFIVANRPAKVNFDGHFGDAKLLAKGTIGPLEPTADIDVIVAVDTDSVSTISPLAGRDLPDIGPLSLSVRLTGKEGKYIASDLLTVLEDKNLTAEAKGSIADLAALNGLKLEAKVDTNHLSELLKIIGIQSEYLLPDSLNATTVVSGSLRDPTVEHFQTRIQGQGLIVNGNGEIKNIMTLKGVSADFSMETESLDLIADIAKTKKKIVNPKVEEGETRPRKGGPEQFDNYAGRIIVFGSGGGFTGKVEEYYVQDDGTVFHHSEIKKQVTEIASVGSEAVKKYFDKLDGINFKKLIYQKPSNMYYYVMERNGDAFHKVTWGDMKTPPPMAVKAIYDEMRNELVKRNTTIKPKDK